MVVQREAIQHTGKWTFSLYIGFFAGLIWGALQMLFSYLHFTSLQPGFMVEAFFKKSFLASWQGYMLGWVVFICFSIVASLLYAWLLVKVVGPWMGLGYGFTWWAAIFLLIGPVTGMMNWIAYLDWNTILSEACLFLLWGLFIGYSIGFEFNNERAREPFEKRRQSPQTE